MIPGTAGFGVSPYTGTLPIGFSALTGSNDITHNNYGNYQYSDGSIMCYIPAFYYRIGHASAKQYQLYLDNVIEIVGFAAFDSESTANTAGFSLHRAFVDGGAIKNGFFIDKYLASKNGSTSCKSVANVEPISLTTSVNYNPSSTMTSCTGILADAVVLARSRGIGIFNVASIFMYNALAMISLAHAQNSATTTHCAWYDPIYNFPKGCNDGELKDINDPSVTYTRSASGTANDHFKPNTGSAGGGILANPTIFAKTTHNGQTNGVADLNGCMYQVMLGITTAGNSATDTANITSGNQYVLKPSTALASLTAGWNGISDAWGDATNLATNYNLISAFMTSPTGRGTYFGNGIHAVFSNVVSTAFSADKTDYLKTNCGYPLLTGESASGTNQFGNNYHYHSTRANQFPLGSGAWGVGSGAGVWNRGWYNYRSNGNVVYGFRVSAYL
jgi:hypothetical protein